MFISPFLLYWMDQIQHIPSFEAFVKEHSAPNVEFDGCQECGVHNGCECNETIETYAYRLNQQADAVQQAPEHANVGIGYCTVCKHYGADCLGKLTRDEDHHAVAAFENEGGRPC